jgi:hypothetical protein
VKLKDAPGATVSEDGAMEMWSRWGVGWVGVVGGVGLVGEVGVLGGVVGELGEVGVVGEPGVVVGGVEEPVGVVVSVLVRVPQPAMNAAARRSEPIVSRARINI